MPRKRVTKKVLDQLQVPETYRAAEPEGQPWRLTPKQRRFCLEYLVDLNATQAAIRAGYKPETAYSIGHENLTKPEISAVIAQEQAARAGRTLITQDRVAFELAKIGFANMQDYVRPVGDGSAVVALDDLTRDQWAAISEITVDSYMDGRGEDAREVKRVKLKLHDKKGALAKLGEHLGMFGAKPPEAPPMDDERRRAARQELLRQLGDLAKPTPLTITEDGKDA